MTFLFTNNATTTLASSITAAATTIPLASGTGSLFPSPSSPDVFHATLADVSGNTEIVKVTSRSTDSLTVVRAQEGTAARNFAAGDRVELRLTAAALNSLAQVDSQVFTGTPKVPTPPPTDVSERIANMEALRTAVEAVRAETPSNDGTGATGEWGIDIAGKAAENLLLTGGNLSGNLTSDVVDMGSGTVIDVSKGPVFRRTVSAPITLTVSNVPAAGKAVAVLVQLDFTGNYAVTFWTGVRWASGYAPTLSPLGKDVLGFVTFDGGANWLGVLVGRDFK